MLKIEAPILWLPEAKIDDSLEKTLTLGKIEGRRRMQDDRSEMVGWHHRFNGHEFEQTLRNGEDSDAWHAAVHEAAKSRA